MWLSESTSSISLLLAGPLSLHPHISQWLEWEFSSLQLFWCYFQSLWCFHSFWGQKGRRISGKRGCQQYQTLALTAFTAPCGTFVTSRPWEERKSPWSLHTVKKGYSTTKRNPAEKPPLLLFRPEDVPNTVVGSAERHLGQNSFLVWVLWPVHLAMSSYLWAVRLRASFLIVLLFPHL